MANTLKLAARSPSPCYNWCYFVHDTIQRLKGEQFKSWNTLEDVEGLTNAALDIHHLITKEIDIGKISLKFIIDCNL